VTLNRHPSLPFFEILMELGRTQTHQAYCFRYTSMSVLLIFDFRDLAHLQLRLDGNHGGGQKKKGASP